MVFKIVRQSYPIARCFFDDYSMVVKVIRQPYLVTLFLLMFFGWSPKRESSLIRLLVVFDGFLLFLDGLHNNRTVVSCYFVCFDGF